MMNAKQGERVVVTGMGALSPNGIGVASFWQNTLNGISGITPLRGIEPNRRKALYGGEIHDFNEQVYPAPRQPTLGRGGQMALAAGLEALDQAGIDLPTVQSRQTALLIGTTMGESKITEGVFDHQQAGDPPETYATHLAGASWHMLATQVGAFLGLKGSVLVVPTACAAGNFCIAQGAEMILSGDAEIVLAGGSDPWSRIGYEGFCALNAVSPDVCRPFDLERRGILISEGAAMLVLEAESHARRRGADILAEVAGWGLGADGHHMTRPHPQGRGGLQAARRALRIAGRNPDQLDYISAHGTGTRANDRLESHIIKTLLGPAASQVPVSSIKSMLGHTMGAASALEAIVCIKALQEGRIPPTINYAHPDPDCDLDVVPNQGRDHSVSLALNQSYAFGGNCAATLFAAYGG